MYFLLASFPFFSISFADIITANTNIYDTIIPRLVRLAEAPSHGKPILEYEPRNKGTIAYLNLAKEVILRNGTKEESPR